MDYEGLCEDLLEMEHKAAFYAAGSVGVERPNRVYELMAFAYECQEFRRELFRQGYGYGGH